MKLLKAVWTSKQAEATQISLSVGMGVLVSKEVVFFAAGPLVS